MIRILTHNTHVPYLYLLSKIPNATLEVFSFRFQGRDWQNIYREKPANLVHVPIDHPELIPSYISMLPYDVIIIQDFNFMNILTDPKNPIHDKLQPIKKIFLFHNSMFTEMGNLSQQERQKKIQDLYRIFAQNNIRPVAISEFKAATWGGNMPVISPGIDTNEFTNCWSGKNNLFKFVDKFPEYSLRVCSNFEARDFMNGYKATNAILSRVQNPAIILGENPPVKENISQNIWTISQNFNHYRGIIQNARFLLTANNANYEDYYNLSSLEAAAMGCPVVFTQHDGQSMVPDFTKYFPLTSNNTEYLSGECARLLNDLDYARTISEKQKGFVEKYFPISKFVENWQAILEAK